MIDGVFAGILHIVHNIAGVRTVRNWSLGHTGNEKFNRMVIRPIHGNTIDQRVNKIMGKHYFDVAGKLKKHGGIQK